MAKLAFLGLGVMGYPMAGHLAAKGHEVTVYNRTAAKAEALARETGLPHRPDVLIRPRATPSLGGMGHDHRFQTMAGAITLREGQRRRIAGRPVLIVDDVMTSGASLSAAAETLVTHGAAEVSILVLARAGRAT